MKYIVSGTNRRNSRTRQLANIIQKLYQDSGDAIEIIDLAELPFQELTGEQYAGGLSAKWLAAISKINAAEGLVFVVPEYNGSLPGALKYFIDHWKYPDSFEYRPVCFVGLGLGPFSGIRPIEHLQHIMGYRNSFQYPIRVFVTNAGKSLIDGVIQDPLILQLLKDQMAGFKKYVKALEAQGLDANSAMALRARGQPKK